mgnify:CR=1 FL=1
MRIGVHARSMAPQQAPEVARVLERMAAHGLAPLLDQETASWLRANGEASPAGTLSRTSA